MSSLDQYQFSRTHEWVFVEGSKARVGITDYAQHEITDVVFVELPKLGKVYQQGEACAVVESVKAAFDIYTPLSGRVVAINQGLVQSPARVNQSPYEEGWFFEIEMERSSEIENLMTHPQYQEFLKK